MPLDRNFFTSKALFMWLYLKNAAQILFFTLFLQVVSNTQNRSHGESCTHDKSLETTSAGCCSQGLSIVVSPDSRLITISS